MHRITEKVVLREYIREPLDTANHPEEADVEAVCALLMVAGVKLDVRKNLDSCFVQLTRIIANDKISVRVREQVQVRTECANHTNRARNVSQSRYSSTFCRLLSTYVLIAGACR